MATQTIVAATLRTRVAGIFTRLDVPSEDAGIVAHHLVEADLRGVHSHGVIRVPTYVTGLKAGRFSPHPNREVVEDHGGQVVMDGDNGLGQLTAFRANELAIQRGKEHGMAAVALRRSTHCGAMASYAIRAPKQAPRCQLCISRRPDVALSDPTVRCDSRLPRDGEPRLTGVSASHQY
jgi:L-2-hydroxycarboxylate dehydrogenase (NAD+)